jgi:pyrroloquinoline quinone (PQQ) biosynthesis protein C
MDLREESPVAPFEAVKAAARADFARRPIERHALFAQLARDALSPEQARAIALDIHHVVAHFPRFLSAVLTSLEDHRLRMQLVENLYNEHGAMDPARVHVVTYRTFLRELGLGDAAIDAHAPALGAVVYVRAVLALCQREVPAEALAALAVIEEVVARVSPLVGRWGARHGAHDASHFGVHEELDLTHADELYELAARFWSDNEPAVRRGLALGAYYQRRLYSDLLAERALAGEEP